MTKKSDPPQPGLSRRNFPGTSGAIDAAIGLGETAAEVIEAQYKEGKATAHMDSAESAAIGAQGDSEGISAERAQDRWS
ncbi:MAG TPA: hypothetical protein VIN05_00910 [Roseovarius sp.]